MAIISSIIIGLLNAYRGGNYSAGKWYDIFFSKWAVVAYFYVIAFAVTGWLNAIYFVLPIIAMFTIGTGGLMQAFTDGIIDNREFTPIDWIANKLVGYPINNVARARKWGVYFGSVVGIFFTIPFIITGKYLLGLPMLGLGLYCGAMRYIPVQYKWRIIEFGYFLLYSILFFYA